MEGALQACRRLKRDRSEERRISTADLEPGAATSPTSFEDARKDAEHQLLIDALQGHQGNISRGPHAIRISRPAFHRLLAKHSLRAEEFKIPTSPRLNPKISVES